MSNRPNALVELGKKQAALFNENNVAYVSCLVKFNSQRHILLWCYTSFVGSKKIIPIEELPKSDKESIWEMAKEMGVGLDKNGIIELCKAFYTLEYLLRL
jgi:hypothetical protein